MWRKPAWSLCRGGAKIHTKHLQQTRWQSQVKKEVKNDEKVSFKGIRDAWKACGKTTRWGFGVIAVCEGIESAGIGMVVPFLPSIAEEFELGATGVGAIISAAALGKVVSNMPVGKYADTRGRRPLLIWGQILTAAGILFTAVAPNIATLFAARLTLGIGAAASAGGTSAYMADIAAPYPQHRGILVGVIGGISSISYVMGPSIGGLLAGFLGTKGPFYAFSAVTLLTTAAFYTLPETLKVKAKQSEDKTSALAEWKQLWKAKEQRALVIANVALHIGWASYLTLLPLHAVYVWGADPIQLGLMYSAASGIGLVGIVVAGWASDKFGRLPVMLVGTVLNGLGCVILCVAQTYWQFFTGLLIWEVGEATLTAVLSVLSIDHAPEEKRGQSLSLQRQSGDLTLLIAPLVLGFMSDLATSGAALGIAGCALSSAILLFRSYSLLRKAL